jgi:hypothetical protein
MLYKAINASPTTDVTAEISRLQAWCTSKAISIEETLSLVSQVQSALLDFKTAALAVSSGGSTLNASRSIKTDNCSVIVKFESELKRSLIATFFKRIGLG